MVTSSYSSECRTWEEVIQKYKFIIFDLDNTLYDETLYLRQAYHKISAYLARISEWGQKEIFIYLENELIHSNQSGSFTRLLEKLSLPSHEMSNILDILRTQKLDEKMRCFPVITDFLDKGTSQGIRFFILTNGNILQQQNKILHLELSDHFQNHDIYYADIIEPKPSPEGLLQIVRQNNLTVRDCIFIGDDKTDEIAAKRACMAFIYIKKIVPENPR
tara:strand:- start:298 stop:951 length:654 start_codon:yes stop_codon:yes gene_type:complete